jgi:tyrosine-protein phosphatase SIW14
VALLPRIRSRWLRYIFATVLLVLTIAGSYELRWALSHRSEKLSLEGVGNFGRMNAHLYRGAQPTEEGFANLRRLGVDTVVRLSLNEEAALAEQRLVESHGMSFVSLPWSSVHPPNSEQIVKFLALVKEHPDRTIFVHCKAGADRTGVFVALYRIALNHWTAVQAIDEMKAFRYRSLFLPHLQDYIEAFPAKLNSEPPFVQLETTSRY